MSNETIKKGEWVQIHKIVLKSEERTGKIPEDTKEVPMEMWVKGFLQEDAVIGDDVEIKTLIGRRISGSLITKNPTYNYSFGAIYVPELLQIGIQARNIMEGCEE